jgi:hypothetical protein
VTTAGTLPAAFIGGGGYGALIVAVSRSTTPPRSAGARARGGHGFHALFELADACWCRGLR